MKKTAISLAILAVLTSSNTSIAGELYQLNSLNKLNDEPIESWIENNQGFKVKLISNDATPTGSATNQSNQPNQPNQFQILLGDNDISSLFEFKNNELVFNGDIPLPAGENTIIISQLIENQWIEIGSAPLAVMTRLGFKQAQWTKFLEININSQLDERASGDATVSDRPEYSDVTSSMGLSGQHETDNLSIQSHINLLHVSNRQQAIQYGTKLNRASKLDVADYAVTVTNGNHQMTVGHTSFGNNSLLIDGLSRRGISWQYENENQLTFNGAILSGSDLVGYTNFFGLSDYSEQYVNSLGFGFNTFTDSRISLRVEGSYLDAERKAQNDFGVGEVASSETNQGMGFKFIATDNQGRFNGDLTIGLSRYDNPDDNNLSFGDDLVVLNTETALAHNLNLSYLLVQDWQSPWGSIGSITLNANHSSAEPLYQTLTAFVQANVENKLVSAQYQFGNVSGNLGFQSARDNLDNIITLLTTKTENKSFSSSIPVAQILFDDQADEQPNPWLPGLDYSFQETHQFAINSPDEGQSGFNNNSHLPDQLTTNHNLSASWQVETVSLALQTGHSFQDNRQLGRELSDFGSLQHSLSMSWQQDDNTSWSLALGKNRQADLENSKIQYSKSVTVSYAWQSIDGLGVSVNYGVSKDDDSLNDASNLSTTADVGIVKNLIESEWWLPANGSISLRLNYNDSETIDNVFDFSSRFGTKTAQLGINLSF